MTLDLSGCSSVNERAAAYSFEILRLERVQSDLLAALEGCVTDDGAHCLAYGTDTPKIRRRLAAINAIARAAITKAKGE